MVSKRLGRGLDALITQSSATPETPLTDSVAADRDAADRASRPIAEDPSERAPSDRVIRLLDPKTIVANRVQPRLEFDDDAMHSLQQSIERDGVLQPIVVQPRPSGGYELIAGERRLRATRLAGLESIPAIVRDDVSQDLLELALIENIQREDLNPIELAIAYRALLDKHDWTQAQLSDRLGKSRSGIANVIRLLELESELQDAVATGAISQGHAKVLLSVEDSAERMQWFEQVIHQDWSVRELERQLTELETEAEPVESATARSETPPSRPTAPRPPEIEEQEQLLAGWIGAKVRIQPGNRKGSGRMTIDFYSSADFERLKNALKTLGPNIDDAR